jgi:hypothetical protein
MLCAGIGLEAGLLWSDCGMDATRFLRRMHADQKMQFKRVLSSPDAAQAARLWQALQPVLTLHEEIEDMHLYRPMLRDQGLATPLGDWQVRHDLQVQAVKAMIAEADKLEPGDALWRMSIAKIHDMLQKHIMEEELEVFPRVDQAWDLPHRQQIGEDMQAMLDRGPALATASGIAQSAFGVVVDREPVAPRSVADAAAASTGLELLQPGAEVVGSDGTQVGTVKEVRGSDFLVNRPMARDIYIPFSAASADGGRVTLRVPASEVDHMNWPLSSLI